MPIVPIIDSHVHLWDPTRFHMPWLDGNERIGRAFGLQDYVEHTAGIEVEGIVYLEVDIAAPYTLLEPRWVAELPPVGPPILGIVPFAPVEYGDRVRAFLEALVAVDPRVKGVRRIVQGESDPNYSSRGEFISGVRALPDYGLSFDICVYHPQLASAIRLVEACPKTSFILDHIAKPAIKDGLLDPWRQQITALASFPNVVCKLSGMVTEADHQSWRPDQLRPYAEHILDAFGEDRVLYGGDWPVVLMASPYRRWIDTAEQLISRLPVEAQVKVWRDNARRVYRLD
ncbi:MAG: amidohydrolase family protein [Chloroflexota bacterium]